jgi:hypothetical protein
MSARRRTVLACLLLAALCGGLGACRAPEAPSVRLSGLLFDGDLDEVSGLAASRHHPDLLWVAEDGGNPPRLHALSRRGRHRATFVLAGLANTDWEDLAAFELDGKPYLLIADTGDNGGLRRTLLLHVVPEPPTLQDGVLKPAWSIAFRWPDGARDCEAVAVDARARLILLVSKRREPPELFGLPLQPRTAGLQTARRIGDFAGVPQASAEERRSNRDRARTRNQVTAADLSPDGTRLALMTYRDVLVYDRAAGDNWARAIRRQPQRLPLPFWLHQAEALASAGDGRGLYASGEFSPAPLLYLAPAR